MKLINGKLAAAVLALGSASSVLAVSPTSIYQFQFNSGVAGFTPSYIWVSGLALNTPMSIDQAIKKFTIKTPEGTWTAGQFSPSSTPPAGTTIGTPPFWATLAGGILPQVEIVDNGNKLIFLQSAQLEVPFTSTITPATVGTVNGDYNVVLSSGHISDTFTTVQNPTPQDAVNNGANGEWDNVNPVRTTNTPEVAGTAWLMLGAFGILGAFQYAQRRSVSTNA